jgi:membrane protein implicated in regulation of membrane protease activity
MITPDPANTRAAEPADDAGGGLVMFFVFIVAVLASTGAVVLIALVGTWWMLGFGFAIHVIVTAVVLFTVVHVIAGPARARAERDRRSPAPNSRVRTRPQAGKRPVTVP